MDSGDIITQGLSTGRRFGNAAINLRIGINLRCFAISRRNKALSPLEEPRASKFGKRDISFDINIALEIFICSLSRFLNNSMRSS